MSTLRGASLARLRLDVPPVGGWLAVVAPASGAAPALGAAELVIGDLVLRGQVIRAGEDSPDQPVAVVAGGPGWDLALPRQGAYGSPGGVRLSTVLADLSRLSGEAYNAPSEAFLGDAYEWPSSASGAPTEGRVVLADLVLRGALTTWRVDPTTGRTRFDPWPSIGAADKIARVLSRNTARGVRRLGLDRNVAALLPGSTIEGASTRRLTIMETAGALTALVREQ